MRFSDNAILIEYIKILGLQKIIVDFDGVVLDSEPVQSGSYILTLNEVGVNTSGFLFNKYMGKNELQIWREISVDYGISKPISELSATRTEILTEKILAVEPSWFIKPILELFREVELVLVSSGVGTIIDTYLEKCELKKYFSDFYMSHDIQNPIDKKSVLRELLTENPETILIIEDSIDYILLSKGLGSNPLWIRHSLNVENEDLAKENDIPMIYS
jgi:beta-phosphoglucomutase-like phosphatase (HAD superfamily)